MNSFLRVLLAGSATFSAFTGGHAEDAVAAEPTVETKAPAAAIGTYQLKNKSGFALPHETRAPFWPIGWVKGKPNPTQFKSTPQAELDERSFNVTSILLGNPSLAIISGRTYSEGEMLRMPTGSPAARVKVMRITDGSVTVQHDDQVIVLALRRPELVGKKPGNEVLNSDR